MDSKEVWNIALAIISSLGGGSLLVFALSSWLGKVWASRILEQEKSEHIREIEGYKKNLELLNTRDQIRFSKLHESQAEAIKILYRKVFKLKQAVGRTVSTDEHDKFKKELEDELKSLAKCEEDLRAYFNDNRILFHKSICLLVDKMILLSSDVWFKIETRGMFNLSKEDIKEEKDKLNKIMKDKVPSILKKLETEFRKLMGV